MASPISVSNACSWKMFLTSKNKLREAAYLIMKFNAWIGSATSHSLSSPLFHAGRTSSQTESTARLKVHKVYMQVVDLRVW